MKFFGKKENPSSLSKSSKEKLENINANDSGGIPSCITPCSSERRGSRESSEVPSILRFKSASNLDSSSSSNVTRRGGVTFVQKEKDKDMVRFSPNTKLSEINSTYKRDGALSKQPKNYHHSRKKNTIREERQDCSFSSESNYDDEHYYKLYRRSKSRDSDSQASSWKLESSVESKDFVSPNHVSHTSFSSNASLLSDKIDQIKISSQPRSRKKKKKTKDHDLERTISTSESVNLEKYNNKYRTIGNDSELESERKFTFPYNKSFASSCKSIDEDNFDGSITSAFPQSEATNYNVEYPWSSGRNQKSLFNSIDENDSYEDSHGQMPMERRKTLSKLHSDSKEWFHKGGNDPKNLQEETMFAPKETRVRFQNNPKIYTRSRSFEHESIAPSYASSYASEYEYGPYRCVRPSDFLEDDYSDTSSSYDDDFSDSQYHSVRSEDFSPPWRLMCSSIRN